MQGAVYSVTLDSCVDGAQIAAVMSYPFDRAQIPHETLGRLRRYTTDSLPLERLVSLGNSLADLLLPGTIRDALSAHLHAFPTAPVTLRLKIAHDDLAALPWEFLRLEAASHVAPQGWLFQNDRITLRREAGSAGNVSVLPIDQLRVLIVRADPNSARFKALLHLTAEVAALRAVLRRQGVHNVTELHRATPEDLCTALQTLRPHILHFIGHGQQRSNDVRLILSGAEPNSDASLAAEKLADWLADTPIRLVTLAACDTLGVAHALMERKVPAVVAMQGPLSDDLAVPFTHNFYLSLLQPCPVATALAHTRSVLRGSGPGWGLPTLVQSVESDVLFTHVKAPFHVPLLRNKEFVGHRALLAEMHRTLSDTDSVPVTLFGMGGQGKTQLAAEYAYFYRDAYPDGVFWIRAATPQELIEDLERIGRLFFALPEERTPQEAAAYVQEKLQNLNNPALLIYDNVSWGNDADSSEKPELFLPVLGPCRVIVTTRDRLLSPPLARVFDPQLAPADSLSLLTRSQLLLPGEFPEAQEILRLTGALPLALVLAAHHIERSQISIREYRESLEHSRVGTLIQSRRGFISTTKHNGIIFNAITISYEAQEAAARTLLALLACFNRQSISPDLAFRASGLKDRMAFQAALADLIDGALLRREEDNRLALHELVRVFVVGAQSPKTVQSAASAVGAVLADQIRRANETMQWNEIRRELPHCRAVMQICREQGVTPPLVDLLLAYSDYLAEHRELAAAEECCLEGIALTEVAPASRLSLAHFWRIYSEVLVVKRESKDDYADCEAVEKACEIAAQTLPADDPERWHFYNSRGFVLKMHDRISEALPYYEEAFKLCRQAFGGNDERIALILNNMAALQEKKGDFTEALRNYRHSLTIYSAKYGNGHSKTAVRLNNIGRVLYALGDYEEALTLHAQAFRIHSKTYLEGNINALMSQYYSAFAYYSLGRVPESHDAYAYAREGLQAIFGDAHPFYCQLKARWQELTGDPVGESNIAPLETLSHPPHSDILHSDPSPGEGDPADSDHRPDGDAAR